MNTVETNTIQEVADMTGLGYQVVRNMWKRGEIEGYQRVKNGPIQLFRESWQRACPQKPEKEEFFEPVKVEYDSSDQVSMEEVGDPAKKNHAGKKKEWKRIEGRISPEREAWVEETKKIWGIKRDCDFLEATFEITQSALTLMKYAPTPRNDDSID